ncbi:hypothetical protein QVD17_17651 [Tagetes erecta]|uniref:J domain-containing protein n=1 Tax=Tagetes erecta TaxID=13708 RepID=A0AAD8KXA3_TARER|nr:hypothetical protein QVD17_17651 [Tagetes erecta]
MNKATKLALINFNNYPFNIKTLLFHSTPVLDRRRRKHWEYGGSSYRSSSRRSNFNSRKQRKFYSKQELLRNFNAFSENLFQDWHDRDEYGPSSSHGNSWYKNFNGGSRRSSEPRDNNKGAQGRARKKGFQFYDEFEDAEKIFRSAFGTNDRFYFWSFVNDESSRSSSRHYNNDRASWHWRQQFEHDYEDDDDDGDDDDADDDDYEPERVGIDLRKDRIALGLSGSGPLSLEDVKNAYRACALKWHPDRHNGSSKAAAEEKFKVCSAAYQSLCDKLAPS